MRVADDMEVDDLDDLLEEFAGSNFGSRPTEPARQDWVAGGHFGSEGIDADELLGELDATLAISKSCVILVAFCALYLARRV